MNNKSCNDITGLHFLFMFSNQHLNLLENCSINYNLNKIEVNKIDHFVETSPH